MRNWAGFDAEKESGIISLSDLVKLTSIDHFRKRFAPDYISHYFGVGNAMKGCRRSEDRSILVALARTRPIHLTGIQAFLIGALFNAIGIWPSERSLAISTTGSMVPNSASTGRLGTCSWRGEVRYPR